MDSFVAPEPALSGNEYRVLTEHSPVMIWRSGLDAACDYFNATWLEFTGRRYDQELGNGWAEGVHPEDLSKCILIYLSSFEQRVPFEMRYRLRRHDGEYRYLLDRGVPFNDAHGQFAGFIGSCIDVQAAHEAQISLKAQEQQALETSDAIQRRIGRDLHDGLGQLLTGIAFVAKEIEGAAVGAVKARAQRLIELIARSVEHTQNLARGLAPLHLEHTSLEIALQDLARSISQDNDVACTLSCAPGAAITDAGARTQLFLITQEAIANAIRHGGARHIGIELTGDDSGTSCESSTMDAAWRHRHRAAGSACKAWLSARGCSAAHSKSDLPHRAELRSGALGNRFSRHNDHSTATPNRYRRRPPHPSRGAARLDRSAERSRRVWRSGDGRSGAAPASRSESGCHGRRHLARQRVRARPHPSSARAVCRRWRSWCCRCTTR